MKYAFWNNKGGTGKTSLLFQTVTTFGINNSDKKILVIDLCPQANISELLCGGLQGNGSQNLNNLYKQNPRKSIGGYFQMRIPNPFSPPEFNYQDYIVQPNSFNGQIPENIELLAGDKLLEIQGNALTSLANSQLPGVDARLSIIDWINDFIDNSGNIYNNIFIDTNPSFSIHTQIALASVDRLVLPIMADDSSRRAISNVFALVYGVGIPNPIYDSYLFSNTIENDGRQLPKVHLIIRNRLTQYMGEASAYGSVLNHITNDIQNLLNSHPSRFTFTQIDDNVLSIKDFGTTGVVAFAEGTSFLKLDPGIHNINGRDVQINTQMLDDCRDNINSIVDMV